MSSKETPLTPCHGDVSESQAAAGESQSEEKGQDLHQIDENVSTLVSSMNADGKVRSKAETSEGQPPGVSESGSDSNVQSTPKPSGVDPNVDNKSNKKSNDCDKGSGNLPASLPANSDTSANLCTKQPDKTQSTTVTASVDSTHNAPEVPHILISPAVSGDKDETIVQKTIEKSNASFTFDLNSDTNADEGNSDNVGANPTSIDPTGEDPSKQLSDPAVVGQSDSGVFTVHVGEVEEDQKEATACKDKNSVEKCLELVVCKQRPPSSKARELGKQEEEGEKKIDNGNEKVEDESENRKQEDEGGKGKLDESGNEKHNDESGNRKLDDSGNRKLDDSGNRKLDDTGNGKQEDESRNENEEGEDGNKKLEDKTESTEQKADTGDGGKDGEAENGTKEIGTEKGTKESETENGTKEIGTEKGTKETGTENGTKETGTEKGIRAEVQENGSEAVDAGRGKEAQHTQQGKIMSIVGTPAPRMHSRTENRAVHRQEQKRRSAKHASERAKFQNCLSGIDEVTATHSASPNRAGATSRRGEQQNNNGDKGGGLMKPSRNEIVLSDKSGGKNDSPSKVNILDSSLALAISTQTNRESKSNGFTNAWSPREKLSPRREGRAETKMESPRISSSRSSKISSFDSNKSSPRVSSSITERPFSRQELRRALPRKSFFSSHDKAMKDAGYQVEDGASKKKAERLKARLEKIANEFNPLSSKLMTRTAGESQDNQSDNIQVVVTDTSKKVGVGEQGGANGDSTEIDAVVDANTLETLTSAEAADGKDSDSQTAGSLKPGLRQGKRKPAESGKKSEYVECKPLSHYLEYVKDNKQEYLQHELTASGMPRQKAVSRLIKMGQAFQLRHHGGVPRQQHDEDILVRAAKALRPRTADVSRMGRQPSARSVLRSGDVAHRQARPPSEDKRQEKNPSPSPAAATGMKEEDQPKTEMEKRKVKAQDWTRSVSTNTLTKARIQCLRELGADDVELTKWWDAFRNCHYLRHKSLGMN